MKYLAALLATLAIPVFFISGNSSAASQTFTYDSNSDPKPNQVYWTAVNSYQGLTFTPTYALIEGVATRNDTTILAAKVSERAFSSYANIYVAADSSYHFSVLINCPWGINGNFQYVSSWSITFYDYNPASFEPCPECPEQPDLPYGEKLDRLYYAVIIVSATMLVLYFMFAIYSMFFKGLK